MQRHYFIPCYSNQCIHKFHLNLKMNPFPAFNCSSAVGLEETYDEGKDAIQDCGEIKSLMGGNYGVVRVIEDKNESKIVLVEANHTKLKSVVKITPIFQDNGSKGLHQKSEIDFLTKIITDHPSNLVAIQKVVVSPTSLICVMQHGQEGDLAQHNQTLFNYITKQQMQSHICKIRNILWQVIQGLQTIHAYGYVYRDLKPANLIISHAGISHKIEGNVKICDFGLVAKVGEIDASLCGTPQYMPPQRLTEKRKVKALDFSIDLWSLGIVVYEFLMGRTPFSYDGNIQRLIDQIYSGHIYVDPDLPCQARNLIMNLLQTNPLRRLSLEKVKRHPFFKDHLREDRVNPAKLAQISK